LKILFSGGGTAGHINPALAVAKNIKEIDKNAQILFIGTEDGLEKELVPKEGFNIEFINVQGFERKLSIKNICSVIKSFKGIFQAKKIINKFKPDVVVGTGGYVCGSVVLCAAMMKIPTVIHEQNVFPGFTIKILSKFALYVALSFKESEKYIKRKKEVYITGNPVRKELLESDYQTCREKMDIGKDKFLILAFGGSLGAEKINETVVDFIKTNVQNKKIIIILGTGKREYELVIKKLKENEIDIYSNNNVKIYPYIYNMNEVMAASDLVICRAGAITLSELTAIGKPSILIPSPYVANNHQEYNAKALEKIGAAIVLDENKINSNSLTSQVKKLIENRELLGKMKKKAQSIGKIDATKKLTNLVLKAIE
jgi:UDP-N-acetylglucosamine--N-acetylmuramyl-(pentapeptide) pyrophosphoryl-undecaprenol N-acetylglucosamine transferase